MSKLFNQIIRETGTRNFYRLYSKNPNGFLELRNIKTNTVRSVFPTEEYLFEEFTPIRLDRRNCIVYGYCGGYYPYSDYPIAFDYNGCKYCMIDTPTGWIGYYFSNVPATSKKISYHGGGDHAYIFRNAVKSGNYKELPSYGIIDWNAITEFAMTDLGYVG